MAGVTGVCFAGAVGSECVTGAVEMKVRSAVFASATGGIASCGALADVAVAATCVVTRGCTGTGAGVVAGGVASTGGSGCVGVRVGSLTTGGTSTMTGGTVTMTGGTVTMTGGTVTTIGGTVTTIVGTLTTIVVTVAVTTSTTGATVCATGAVNE
jgi:hypothetical protein